MRASADTFSKEEHHIIVDNALRASCASVKDFGDDSKLKAHPKRMCLLPILTPSTF